MFLSVLLGIAVVAGTLPAQERPNFSGKWKAEANAGESVEILQDEDSIRLAVAGQPEIACNTMGKDCDVKLGGKPAKVSFYFNGPMLVEFRTEGERVTKIRRKLSEDGTRLTMEIMPLSPSGKTREVIWIREPEAAKPDAGEVPPQ
jgi:hypothetical protein